MLPKRPDLKLIITSATIDPERFSRALRRRADHRGLRPDLPGRGPLPAAHLGDRRRRRPRTTYAIRPQAICDAVERIAGRRAGRHPRLLLRRARDPRHRRRADRHQPAQHRDPPAVRAPVDRRAAPRLRPHIPAGGSCSPRTSPRQSLTVPGIKYVIDPGTARISRYSHRLKVQRLPIERDLAGVRQPAQRPVRADSPTASASGSTPRTTSSGRPEFTDPEILRTNLAGVILQMTALRTRRHRRRSRSSIRRTSATSPTASRCCRRSARSPRDRTLTPLGRKLAALPVDPRMARMVIEGDKQRLPARGHGDRGRTVHRGSARTPDRQTGAGAAEARPVRRPDRRTSCRCSTCGTTSRRSRKSCRRASSASSAAPIS